MVNTFSHCLLAADLMNYIHYKVIKIENPWKDLESKQEENKRTCHNKSKDFKTWLATLLFE